jgi:hypothetical protein
MSGAAKLASVRLRTGCQPADIFFPPPIVTSLRYLRPHYIVVMIKQRVTPERF